MDEHIGQRVKRAYLDAGMNRRQFSMKSGIDYATIMKWEKGEVEPELPSLRRVVDATGTTTLGALLGTETRLERDDEVPNPHFTAFLALTNLDALKVTPDELEHVKRAPFRGGARSPLDYQRALLAILKIDDLPQPTGLAEAKDRARKHREKR